MTTDATTTDLTPRQRECLDVLVRYIRANNGTLPTIRELMPPLDMASPNGVVGLLWHLEAKGYVRNLGMTARGLQVVGLEVRVDYADSEAGRRLRAALEGEVQP